MQKYTWQRISSAILIAGLFLGFVQPYNANAGQKQQVSTGQPVAGPVLLPVDTAGLPPARQRLNQTSASQAPLRNLPNASLLPKAQSSSNNDQPGPQTR